MKYSGKTKEQLIEELGHIQKKVKLLEKKIKDQNTMLKSTNSAPMAETKQHERAMLDLSESERRFKILFEFAPDAYYLIDLKGNIIDGNRAAEKLTGYKKTEVIGKNILRFSMLSPDDVARAIPLLARNARGKGTGPNEFTLITKKGDKKSVEIHTHPVKIKNRTVVLGIARDITRRKVAEKIIEEHTSRLNKAQQIAKMGFLDWNLKEKKITFSDQIYQLFGINKNNMDYTPEKTMQFIHPDDFENVRQSLNLSMQGKKQHNMDHRILRPDGRVQWVHAQAELIKDLKGNPERLIGTLFDITKRKHTEEDLKQTEEKYRDLIENADIIIMIDDKDGNFKYYNKKFARIFGYSENELKKKSIHKLVHPDDVKMVTHYHKARITGKSTPSRYEFRGIHKQGRTIYLEVDAVPIKEKNRVVGTRSYIWDITKRKQAETIAKANHLISKTINETTNLDQLYSDIHNSLRKYIDATNFYIALYDSRKDIIEFLYYTDEHDDDPIIENASKSGSLTYEVIKTGKTLILKENQLKQKYKKSKKAWGTQPKIWIGVPLRAKEEIIGVISVQSYSNPNLYTEHDVELLESSSGAFAFAMQRKTSFDEIEKRQKYLESVLDSTPDAMITLNPDYHIIEWNPGAEYLYGYTRDEAIGKDLDDLVTNPAVRDEAKGLTKQALSGQRVLPKEVVRYRKDGTPVNVIVSGTPIHIGNEMFGILTVYTDITRLKKTVAALRQSESKYSAVVENSKDGIVIIQEGKLSFANSAAAELLNYSQKNMIGADFQKFIAPVDLQMAAKRYKDRLAGKEVPNIYELTLLRKGGSKLAAEINATLVMIDNKMSDLIFVRDITDRKKAEAAIKESEKKYREVVEQASDLILTTDVNGNWQFSNQALIQTTGYPREVVEKMNYLELIVPEYHNRVKAHYFRQFIKKQPSSYIELPWLTKAGKLLWFAAKTNLIIKKNKVVGFQSIFRDITEQKNAEEALRESEERFRLAANISTDLIYEWEASSDKLIWYGGVDRALGYPENSIPRTISGWINLIHPEDQSKLRDAVTKHRTATKPISEEYRIQHKDGAWRYWMDKGAPILDNKSKPVKWIGSCIDVTEAKKAEQALQESESNYRNLIETSNDGIYLLYNRKFEIVNKKFQEMMGFTQKELNHPDFDVMNLTALRSRPLVEDRIRKAASGEKLDPTYEFTALTKDNKEIEIETTVSYVKYKEGVATLGIFRNISERKHMENLIERINNLKEKLLGPLNLDEKMRHITDGIVDIFDADFVRIWLINPGDRCNTGCFHEKLKKGPHVCRIRNKCLHLKASSGRYTHIDGKIHQRVPFGCYKIGRIASRKEIRFLTNNVQHDKRVHNNLWAKKLGLTSFAGYRLLSGKEEPIGVLAFFSKHKISPAIDDLIQGIANTTTQVIQNSIAEESLRISQQRFSSIFNSAGDGMLYLNKKGTVLEVNPSLLHLTGLSKDELIGKNVLTLARKFSKSKNLGAILNNVRNVLRGHSIEPYELEYRDKIFEVSAPLLSDSPGITGIVHDITEKKQALDKIQHSLEEKDVLLQEIHHRVKNNLMIIIGLLNYYSRNINDENINNVFNNLQNTIHSMALIHEKLYQQEHIAKINFEYYVKDLTNHLLGIHSQYMGQVSFQVTIDNIHLNLRTAIPCGMIISELVSNALKHAFPESRASGKSEVKRKNSKIIMIAIQKGKQLKNGKISTSRKGWFHLQVCDNGIGLPRHFTLKNSKTLGLRLVQLMVEQLEGQIKTGIHKGACFHINFKEQ